MLEVFMNVNLKFSFLVGEGGGEHFRCKATQVSLWHTRSSLLLDPRLAANLMSWGYIILYNKRIPSQRAELVMISVNSKCKGCGIGISPFAVHQSSQM